mmetsp:Transcript_13036/g.27302  ORF Transcript_13036/g.27302 Transcript_13036/m.27302 type:complete len:307 (-) Transcript_13036:777-1697(-)
MAIVRRYWKASTAVKRETAAGAVPAASCTPINTLLAMVAAPIARGAAVGAAATVPAAGTRLGTKAAVVAATKQTTTTNTENLHSQRNSQSCSRTISQSHSCRVSHCRSSAPCKVREAEASAALCSAGPSAFVAQKLPLPRPLVLLCGAEVAAPSVALALGMRSGATERRSSRPRRSCGSARSTAPPPRCNSSASTALCRTSRTRSLACSITLLSPSSGFSKYPEAKAFTADGSQARKCAKSGAFARALASAERKPCTAASTSVALKGRNGNTSVRRPRSSPSMKKLACLPTRDALRASFTSLRSCS